MLLPVAKDTTVNASSDAIKVSKGFEPSINLGLFFNDNLHLPHVKLK